jgi:glyoxylase-like metal-dependent hydrolase (beta-lactamase superfamily II)
MPEHYLTDDELIRFGNHELRVIHTPGHTPGSVFFYCEEEGIAFSGDTLFYKGIGRSDLPGGNKEELKASLKFITEFLPNETVIYPGHGKKSTIGYEKANNPYLL